MIARQRLEVAGQELLDLLRIAALGQGREDDEVDEQDRHEPALGARHDGVGSPVRLGDRLAAVTVGRRPGSGVSASSAVPHAPQKRKPRTIGAEQDRTALAERAPAAPAEAGRRRVVGRRRRRSGSSSRHHAAVGRRDQSLPRVPQQGNRRQLVRLRPASAIPASNSTYQPWEGCRRGPSSSRPTRTRADAPGCSPVPSPKP